MTRRLWTALEVDFLRQAYADHTTEAIAAVLKRTARQIYCKAKSLGLKKSAAYLASPAACRLRRGDEVGKPHRFAPGHDTWNRGMKGYQAGGRSVETQFKKGAMSGAAQHNYVPIGSLRITRYGALERKVTDDPSLYPVRRWRPVAHLVWEAAHGPIPPGHVVRFKSGLHTTVETEITLDRLECVSKAENMRRNSIHNYPPEMKAAMRAVGALNRRIHHVEKHQRSA
jgi:hypothetical protein